MLMKYFLLLTCLRSVYGGGLTLPTGTPIPTPACIGADVCKTFTGWLQGTFRHPHDSHAFVTCVASDHEDGGSFVCGVCHPPLFYSEKCSSCEYNENDNDNICTTTDTPGLAPTTNYLSSFCETKQEDGNFADLQNESYYYSCVGVLTYHMWCGNNALYYNQTCNACMWKGSADH